MSGRGMGGRSTSGERCSRTPTNTARPAVPPRPCRPTVRLRVTRRQSWRQPHKSRHCVHWRLRTHRRRHHRLRVSPSTGRRSAARAGRRRARGEAGPCGHHERVTQSARYKRPRTGQAPGPPGTTSAGSPRGLPEVAQWTRFPSSAWNRTGRRTWSFTAYDMVVGSTSGELGVIAGAGLGFARFLLFLDPKLHRSTP
jgi:hypothetical protein